MNKMRSTFGGTTAPVICLWRAVSGDHETVCRYATEESAPDQDCTQAPVVDAP